MNNLINSTYEHQLAYHYHNIDNRGLLIDIVKKEHARQQCEQELKDNCAFLSNLWNIPIYVGTENWIKDGLNLNSPSKVLATLKHLGYNVPKIRQKNEETDMYELEDSAGKMALVKLLADPTRWPSPSSGEGIKKLLETKETITFRNRYLNAKLYKDIYLSNYNVAATLTGRRGSKKTIFGFGGNSQNFPSRGRLSSLWKECIISRPDRIFFFVDQVSAEDWPVQALSENHVAIEQMIKGINRHYIFASQIFGCTVDDIKNARNNKDGLYTPEQQQDAEMKYYMGKKGRHANNYGMQPTRFSESLAAEGGFTLDVKPCKTILDIIDRIDPNVKRIYHKYIQDCLAKSTHMLQTPLGRERAFLGLRSGEKNYSILNEAYSYIPQSTVGDNTGLAVCGIEENNKIYLSYIVQEGHDSIVQECACDEQELLQVFHSTQRAFKRIITFHNGIEIEIPIEGMVGFDWKHKHTMKSYTEEELIRCYREAVKEKDKFKEEKEQHDTTISENKRIEDTIPVS